MLDSLSSLESADLMTALADPEPHVRRHAIRLAEGRLEQDEELQQAVLKMTDDPAMKVRYQLAFSLGALPASAERQTALTQLARSAPTNAYMLAAIQTSLLDGAAEVLDQLARDDDFRDPSTAVAFLQQLAGQIRRQQDVKDLARLILLIEDLRRQRAPLLPDLLLELTRKHDNVLSQRLRQSSIVEPILQSLIREARESALDANRTVPERQRAIRHLALGRWENTADVYTELLSASQPQPIQQQAVDSLAEQDAPAVATQLLSDWERFSPRLRQSVLQQLLSRSSWQAAILEALESRRIGLLELTPAQRQQLARLAGADAWQALEDDLNMSSTPGLDVLVDHYRAALRDPPDTAAGRQVFRTACASCHRLEEYGHELGPNLIAVQNRGADAILINVLDPNREVNPQYIAYTATTHSGRIVSGMIRSETATSIELVQADNKAETLLRDDIELLISTQQSLMPTGLEKQVSPTAMKDLIGYLRSLAP